MLASKHDIDVVSLVFGTLFIAAALLWGLADDVALPGRGWYLAVVLGVVGAAGLLGSRSRRDRDSDPVDTDPAYRDGYPD